MTEDIPPSMQERLDQDARGIRILTELVRRQGVMINGLMAVCSKHRNDINRLTDKDNMSVSQRELEQIDNELHATMQECANTLLAFKQQSVLCEEEQGAPSTQKIN